MYFRKKKNNTYVKLILDLIPKIKTKNSLTFIPLMSFKLNYIFHVVLLYYALTGWFIFFRCNFCVRCYYNINTKCLLYQYTSVLQSRGYLTIEMIKNFMTYLIEILLVSRWHPYLNLLYVIMYKINLNLSTIVKENTCKLLQIDSYKKKENY